MRAASAAAKTSLTHVVVSSLVRWATAAPPSPGLVFAGIESVPGSRCFPPVAPPPSVSLLIRPTAANCELGGVGHLWPTADAASVTCQARTVGFPAGLEHLERERGAVLGLRWGGWVGVE